MILNIWKIRVWHSSTNGDAQSRWFAPQSRLIRCHHGREVAIVEEAIPQTVGNGDPPPRVWRSDQGVWLWEARTNCKSERIREVRPLRAARDTQEFIQVQATRRCNTLLLCCFLLSSLDQWSIKEAFLGYKREYWYKESTPPFRIWSPSFYSSRRGSHYYKSPLSLVLSAVLSLLAGSQTQFSRNPLRFASCNAPSSVWDSWAAPVCPPHGE